jgi:hypothetical protein
MNNLFTEIPRPATACPKRFQQITTVGRSPCRENLFTVQSAARKALVNNFLRKVSGRRFCLRGSFGLGLSLDGELLAFDVPPPARAFFGFVVLLAHIGLYFSKSFRLFMAL